MLVSTTLTNVKTCFIILVGILSSNCRDFALFMTPRLLILDTFVGPRATIRTPLPTTLLMWHCEEYGFQNRDVSCNYRVQEEEKKRQIFGLMYRGGLLWSFAGS